MKNTLGGLHTRHISSLFENQYYREYLKTRKRKKIHCIQGNKNGDDYGIKYKPEGCGTASLM